MVRETSKGDDYGKIFVGGLASSTSEAGLQEYFEKYGEVTECILMVDANTKRSRGFGFVTFQDPTVVQKVIADQPHNLDNKVIDAKKAVPKGPGQQTVNPTWNVGGPIRELSSNENTIFVGGLSANSTDEDLRSFFSSFGKVVHVKLMYDKESGRMRGFGFVTFDSSEAVEEACRIHYHDFNGKTVEAKKATPREPRMGQGRPSMAGAQMNAGYGYPPMSGQYGVAPAGPPGMAGYMASGYPGTNPMVGAGYAAYGAYGVNQSSMYGAQPTPGATAGLGNYQHQDSNYGPARTSFSSDGSAGYSTYGANADQTGYGPANYGGGESVGRGTNVTRGFHPYGRWST